MVKSKSSEETDKVAAHDQIQVPDYDRMPPAEEPSKVSELPVLQGKSLQNLRVAVGRPPINWGRFKRPLTTLILTVGLTLGGMQYAHQRLDSDLIQRLRQKRELDIKNMAVLTAPAVRAEAEGAADLEQMLLKKCAADPSFCHFTGTTYERDKAFAAAARFFGIACDKDNSPGCISLAGLHLRGDGVPKSMPRVIELYAKACELSAADACTFLGLMYLNGQGVERSLPSARPLLEKGCVLHNSEACLELRGLPAKEIALKHKSGDGRDFRSLFYRPVPK